MIKREHYLRQIRPFYESNLIKIITGIRRCGKSVIMDQIENELRQDGKKTLKLNFEDRAVSASINTVDALIDYVTQHLGKQKLYVFLDEVQTIEHWNVACRTLRLKNVSLFITGSNSKLLSKEFTKELSGRYVAFRVRPFVFAEIQQYAKELKQNYSIADYLVFGGFPQSIEFPTKEARLRYLNDLDDTIVINDMRKTFNCLAIKTPYFGDRRKKVLDDLALIVGAKYITGDIYNNLQEVTLDDLGHCDKVKADKDFTTIIGAKGDKEKIKDRVQELRSDIKDVKKEFDLVVINGRLAQLNGGVALIKVGAPTELEMREKKLRMEDALNATMAAIDEGIVIGGGVAILRAQKELNKFIEENLTGDEKMGALILSKSLETPIRQIAKNAGVDDGVVVKEILSNDDLNYGYDALNDEYCDMFEKGIIDPVKVTRTALESAGSVASTLLTTECVVVQDKDKIESERMSPKE